MLDSMLPDRLSWKKSGRTAQAIRMESEIAVTMWIPAWHIDSGSVFPRRMNSAPSQLSLHTGPSECSSVWLSQ